MNRFNTYFNNDFAACKLLAEVFDPYRNRQVKVYAVPGHDDAVGVSDGTDKWIAPVAGDPFRINIRQLIVDVRAGGAPYRAQPPGGRKKLLLDGPGQPEPPPPTRRKLLVADEQPLPIRRRNVLQA